MSVQERLADLNRQTVRGAPARPLLGARGVQTDRRQRRGGLCHARALDQVTHEPLATREVFRALKGQALELGLKAAARHDP